MEEQKLEEIKSILIDKLYSKIERKLQIDAEIQTITQLSDHDIDRQMTNLEKELNTNRSIFERIKNRNRDRQLLKDLMNLKVEKTMLVNMRNQQIENLLAEKQLLAHNEFKYLKRIVEIKHASNIEALDLIPEEIEYILSYQQNKLSIEETKVNSTHKLEKQAYHLKIDQMTSYKRKSS